MAEKKAKKSKGPAWPESRTPHQSMNPPRRLVKYPQAAEPQADMVGAVEEDFIAKDDLAVCFRCGEVQRFRGEYEKLQVIAAEFAGWKCTNPQCPTHKPG